MHAATAGRLVVVVVDAVVVVVAAGLVVVVDSDRDDPPPPHPAAPSSAAPRTRIRKGVMERAWRPSAPLRQRSRSRATGDFREPEGHRSERDEGSRRRGVGRLGPGVRRREPSGIAWRVTPDSRAMSAWEKPSPRRSRGSCGQASERATPRRSTTAAHLVSKANPTIEWQAVRATTQAPHRRYEQRRTVT